MKPIKFEGFNAIYKSPNDWDDSANGPCADLPVQRKDGLITSRWQPSPDELEVLCGGGSVEISIAGGQPAMSVGAV